MAASAKTLTLGKPDPNGDWTIVLPRRGKQRRNFLKIITPEQQQQQQQQQLQQQQQPWVPTDLEINPNRESKLMRKMQICMKKVESSQFYHTFLDQIQNSQLLDSIFRVLGSELKMQMVIYGIGSIESYESPRLQLSLAILMRRKFNWIGDIEVFDPVLSATESRVLEALGCSVLSVNEQGRRQALKPTLFFMPHCEVKLYDNLLQANWRVELLNHIVLFGNSFEMYSECKSSGVVDSARHILAAQRFTDEFIIKMVSDDYYGPFHESSWHFFNLDHGTELQILKS